MQPDMVSLFARRLPNKQQYEDVRGWGTWLDSKAMLGLMLKLPEQFHTLY